jgi:O-antigen ligase
VTRSRAAEPPTTPTATVRPAAARPDLARPDPAGPGPDRRTTVAGGVALLCLAAVLLESAADLLPDDPVAGVLTPLRVALLAGLVALAVAGARRVTPPAFDVAVAVALGAAAAATLLAGGSWAPWRALLTTAAAAYLAAGVRRVLPGSGPALGLLALVAVAVAGAAGVRQAADGTATGFCRGALDGTADVCTGAELVRVTGTFANPNLLAALLVLLLPVAAAGSAALADRASRLVGSGAVAVGYAALLLTGSRGGVLGAIVGVAVLAVLRRPTRARLLAGAGATAAGVAVLAVATGGRFGVRAEVWAAAAGLVAAHPLGVGPGRGGAMIDAAVPGDEPFAHAHDLWLHWAVESGVGGLLAALALTGIATVAVAAAARHGSVAAAASGAGLAGFAVLSLADHPANASRIALALFVVLGATVAGATGARRGPGRPDGRHAAVRPRPVPGRGRPG